MKDYRESHKEERIARQYEEVVYRKNSYDDMLWKWEQGVLGCEVKNFKKQKSAISLLDFATGTGRILAFLEDKVETALGVDNAEVMLVHARSRVKKAELLCVDITNLEAELPLGSSASKWQDVLAGKQFDLITAFRFFLNAQPELRNAALRILIPKLRNEHSLFIFNIHGNLWSHRLFSKVWYAMRGRRLNTMTVSEVRRLAKRHGLEIVRWYGFGVKPKFLYRLFGAQFMFAVDSLLSKIPGMKYISYDLIFVCRKKNKNP